MEKHNEGDRLKERGRDSLSNEPSLPCLSRCPPNPNICPTKPSLIMTPLNEPHPTISSRTDTHSLSERTGIHGRVPSKRRVLVGKSAPLQLSHQIYSTTAVGICMCCVCEMWVNGGGGGWRGGGGGLGLGLCLRASPALQKTPLNSGQSPSLAYQH